MKTTPTIALLLAETPSEVGDQNMNTHRNNRIRIVAMLAACAALVGCKSNPTTIAEAEQYASERGVTLTDRTKNSDPMKVAVAMFDYKVGDVVLTISQMESSEAAQKMATMLNKMEVPGPGELIVKGPIMFRVSDSKSFGTEAERKRVDGKLR